MQLFDRQGQRLYLTAAERAAFMAAAKAAAPDVRTLCAVLHDTGCRASELLEVTPARVDLPGGCLVFRTLKKRRSGVYRAVPVPPDTLGPYRPRAPRQGGAEARQGTGRQAALAMVAHERLAAGPRGDDRGRHPGRLAPLSQGPAPRLRRACDQ